MIAPSMDVTEWLHCVDQMEQQLREREIWHFCIFDWSPDEVAAATEVLTERVGYCPQIYGAGDELPGCCTPKEGS